MAFYAIATLVIKMVGDHLFDAAVSEQTSVVDDLAVQYAPLFERADMDLLHESAKQAGRRLSGRILMVDMDGKVQLDTFEEYNGVRLAHPEVVSVLRGAARDYGFHKQARAAPAARVALFDFLRSQDIGTTYVGYFTSVLTDAAGGHNGLLLFVVSVQDMVDTLRILQDQMLLIFLVATLAVFVLGMVFTRIITKPIGVLTEGIKRMGRGDLSSRVEVSGIDEIARLGETFNQMSEKLENLDTSRNEFVSNASHELKTPLATMKIMLESMLYQEDMDPALRREFLTDINMELDRLSGIVTDLLTLVQSDANEYHMVRGPVLLRVLAEDTLHRLERLASEKEQTLTLVAQSDAPIFADAGKMQQVIYNIVDNAIKYSPKGGRVRVTVKQEGRLAVLEVTDNGPGIPKKDQPHIFDRFYRVDRARSRATGGNGLGLSIVHQSVMMHDGTVTVQSEEGKGSTFRVELPISS